MDKRKSVLILFSVFLLIGAVSAQSSLDGFEDGDFTSNPSWNIEFGSASNYQVTQSSALNGTYGLELNNIGSDRHRLLTSDSIQQGEIITGWYNIPTGDLSNIESVGILADSSWGSLFKIGPSGNLKIMGDSCTGPIDVGYTYTKGNWIKLGIKHEGGSTQRYLAWDENGNNVVNQTRTCTDWSTVTGINHVAYSGDTNSFSGTIYYDDLAFEGYVPQTTQPISNLNIDDPNEGDDISYESISNGLTVDSSWDNPDNLDTTIEVKVNGNRVYLFANQDSQRNVTIDKSEFNLGQSNNIEVEADDGNNILVDSVNVNIQNPQHKVTSVTSPNPTVDMDLGSGVDIQTNADFNVEAGEQVLLYTGLTTQSSSTSYTCSSGICSTSSSNTVNKGPGTYTIEGEVEGQDSGFTDTQTGQDVTVYDPSLTYNSPTDGASISYSNRNNIDLSYTWDSSNEESVTAYLYYNGNQISSDTLNAGDSITETVSADTGTSNWYVEVTGDTSGDTETFTTQSFTVSDPQNSLTLTNPSDNAEFDSGTTQVTVSTDYSVEEEGNVSFNINGVEEYTESVSAGSGSVSYNYPTQSGEDVTWNASFEGTTGTVDVTSSTRSFSVLQSLASATPVSPTDGQTFSWDQRDVTFEWNSEANDDYTTRLFVDGNQESAWSYSRGSNVDTHTMTLGDPTQDVTYNWYVETEDTNGNTDTSSTRSFTVEQPELSENATLTSPANNSVFSRFVDTTLQGTVETNDISEWRIIVNGNTVDSGTVGTDDRTDSVSQSISYTDSYSAGNYTWKIEVGNSESETRQFEVKENIIDFYYSNPTDGKVYREGVDEIDYNMKIKHERNSTAYIVKNGNRIYSENITVPSTGTVVNSTITYTESVSGSPGTYEWKGEIQNGETITDTDSSSYEIEALPSAVLDSPEDGVYFRNLPESVSHDFNISDTENEVTSELIVDGEVVQTFAGSGSKSGIVDYLEEDIGKHNWTVNTTWTQDTGVEEDTTVREYNTGDPDIAEGRAVDSAINYVSDNLGMSYLGAAILINLTLSMLFAVAVMYSTKSVGYTLLTFGTAFFGLGIIGFLPNILIILLGISAVSVLTIYAWKMTFGGDNE
jgi:hypothetical protein